MNRFMGIVAAVLAVAASGACAPGDRKPQEGFNLMKRISYNSVTEGTGRYRQNQTHDYTITGTGVVVGDKYLTVDHVVSQYEKVTYFSLTPSRVAYTDRQERTYLVNADQKIPLQEIVSDRSLDIAVFQIPEEYCDQVCNGLDESDLYTGDIPLGTDVMFIGYPAKIGFYYRESKFAGVVQRGSKYNGREIPVDAIAIYPSLVTGDSGSGLFDKKTGRLMGINYYNIQTLGLVKPISVYEPYLRDGQALAYQSERAPVM